MERQERQGSITYLIDWEKKLDGFGDDIMMEKLLEKIEELEKMGFRCDSRGYMG